MRPPPAVVLVLLALAACQAWPPSGRGGAAELGGPAVPAADPAADARLAARLACAEARLSDLEADATARGRLTGRVAGAREQAARARREFHGGLEAAAARSLDALDAEAAAIALALPAASRPLPPACVPA